MSVSPVKPEEFNWPLFRRLGAQPEYRFSVRVKEGERNAFFKSAEKNVLSFPIVECDHTKKT